MVDLATSRRLHTTRVENTTDGMELWNDDAALHSKLHKTVGCLSAVAKSISTLPDASPPMMQFVQLHQWAQEVDGEIFERVFRDPRAYHYARTTFDLYVAKQSSQPPPQVTREYLEELGGLDFTVALDDHLTQFGKFACALAYLSGDDLDVLPVRLLLPDVLPGTGWTISGEASVKLCGVNKQGQLRLAVDGKPCLVALSEEVTNHEVFRIELAPEVESIRLSPPTFNLPGLRDIRSVVASSVAGQGLYTDVLRDTLGMIEAFAPNTHRQIKQYMRTIAFKPAGAEGVFNTSCSRLPAASIFTGSRHHLVLADDLIHEFYHNRLFAIEELGGFFHEDEDFGSVTSFYSPWRDDPRPAFGVFHAVYVFERVLAFWVAAIDSRQLSGIELDYASFRAAKLLRQLEIAIAQLIAWANLNERGQQILKLASDAVLEHREACEQLEIQDRVRAMVLGDDGNPGHRNNEAGTTVSATDDLRAHVGEYDVEARCRQIVDHHFEQTAPFSATIAELLN